MRKQTVQEYSKKILSAMIRLWFVGAIYAMLYQGVMLWRAPGMVTLDGLLAYIGAPITGGVVGYLVKSALENREKIKRQCLAEENTTQKPRDTP